MNRSADSLASRLFSRARFSCPAFVFRTRAHPTSSLFPYTTLFRSGRRHPVLEQPRRRVGDRRPEADDGLIGRPLGDGDRSEEHTSELQSLTNLVCRLLIEKKTAAS